MIKLTQDEELLLGEIEANKYANGPFAGMIFNAIKKDNLTIEGLIQLALKVRVKMRDMANGSDPLPPFAGVPQPKESVKKAQKETNDEILAKQ